MRVQSIDMNEYIYISFGLLQRKTIEQRLPKDLCLNSVKFRQNDERYKILKSKKFIIIMISGHIYYIHFSTIF